MLSPESIQALEDIVDPLSPIREAERVKRALSLTPLSVQKDLACDYCQHISWIYDNHIHTELSMKSVVEDIRAAMHDLDHIYEARKSFTDFHYKSNLANVDSEFRQMVMQIPGAKETTEALYLLQRVCLQREFEEEGFHVRTKYQPQATALARKTSFAVGQRAYRISEAERAKEARQTAISDESKWQLETLLTRRNMK